MVTDLREGEFGSNPSYFTVLNNKLYFNALDGFDYDNGQHGTGGSPVLYDDLLIISCDGNDIQYVVALDKLTGKVRWKKSREGYQAYTTPLILKLETGDQVISPGAFRAVSYDPHNGKELWQVTYGEGFSNVPRPVYGDGLVFICTGFQQPSLLAVRIDGKGDVTKSKVAWKLDRGVPLTPSPLLVGNELYLVTDNGIATCVNAKTGMVHWTHRMDGAFSASPVAAEGRLYFQSEQGVGSVIKASKSFEAIAENDLKERTLASCAVIEGGLLIRTESGIVRVKA